MENISRFKTEKNKVESFSSKYENGFFIISFWNTSISYLFHTPNRNSNIKNIDLMNNNEKITYIENIITLYYFILFDLEKGMDFYGNNLYNFIYLILLYLDNGHPTEDIIYNTITYFFQNLHTIEPLLEIKRKIKILFKMKYATLFSNIFSNLPKDKINILPTINQMNQEINQSLNNVNSNLSTTTELSKNK